MCQWREDNCWEAVEVLLGGSNKGGVRLCVREGRAKWEAMLAGCQTFYLNWFPQPPLEMGSIMPILQLSKPRVGEAQ